MSDMCREMWGIAGESWLTSIVRSYRAEAIYKFLTDMDADYATLGSLSRNKHNGVPVLSVAQRRHWRAWQRRGFRCVKVFVEACGEWS